MTFKVKNKGKWIDDYICSSMPKMDGKIKIKNKIYSIKSLLLKEDKGENGNVSRSNVLEVV
jgi:hypothetical protein